MSRCLSLAARGLGKVAPNPLVGCVILHNDQVIAEGYHMAYGQPHAEVNAIAAVADKSLLAECTLVVNLEPCSHHGKTPPCADLIVAHRLKRVVIGCTDPNPLVAGKGIKKLQKAGIEVISGVLENECRELNRRFITFQEKKRPYIILKWAQTRDGFISRKYPFTKQDNWITCAESKKLVHRWRAEEPAIMIGTNTAILDNPELTVRLVEGENPLRVVIDEHLSIPLSHHVFSADSETLIFTAIKAAAQEHITYLKTDFSKNILPFVMHTLHERGVSSVIVEGGAHLLNSFLEDDLWDEARVFTGSKEFGEGLAAPAMPRGPASVSHCGDDELRIFRNGSFL
jgi:diaminohydroxyphosphoribosylaminopyrimidine deaminase / 5-amino-6-(5-phosphoribosylamino)uracil reductase